MQRLFVIKAHAMDDAKKDDPKNNSHAFVTFDLRNLRAIANIEVLIGTGATVQIGQCGKGRAIRRKMEMIHCAILDAFF